MAAAGAAVSVVLLLGTGERGPSRTAALAAEPRADAGVERGRYLVEYVALCVECHTPHDAQGVLVRDELLRGAPIPVLPPRPPGSEGAPGWALRAPNITGFRGYSDAEAIRLLTEGLTRSGQPPHPPMPRYHLHPEDAQAILAFLRSVESEPEPR
jgi:mono/diheme cytochrome c family protein